MSLVSSWLDKKKKEVEANPVQTILGGAVDVVSAGTVKYNSDNNSFSPNQANIDAAGNAIVNVGEGLTNALGITTASNSQSENTLAPGPSAPTPTETAINNLINEVPAKEAEAAKAKETILQQSAIEAQSRQRRQSQASGMSTKNKTILTSPLGVINNAPARKKKTLLGE